MIGSASEDGIALRSIEHPYTISGWDAYGNPVVETIEIRPSAPVHPLRSFLMRHTPWWAWNFIWYRFGFTKVRMITKIKPISPNSIEETEIEIN